MREFSFSLREEFLKGLRPDTRLLRQRFLSECFNVIPTEYGLDPIQLVDDPRDGLETIAFPFPQLFRGARLSLLAGSTSLKQLNETVSPWGVTTLTTYNPASPNSTKAITAGGPWHFAEMGDAWLLFNGSCVVYRTGREQLDNAAAKIFVQDSVTVQTGCTHHGRIICGGFNTANFWQSHWSSIFSAWKAAALSGDPNTGSQGEIGQNFVLWSSIGGGDFPFWLFPQTAYTYDLAISSDRVQEKLRIGEMGWMMMPFQGTIRRVAPLGRNVIVYGDDGIAALSLVSPTSDTPSTYGVQSLARFGVMERGAVAVSEKGHFFLDKAGNLWSLSPALELRRLGYSEFLSGLSTPVLSLDEEFGHLYIGSTTKGFILTEAGFAEHKQLVTSLAQVAGSLVGFSDVPTTDTKNEARVTTEIFNLGRKGINTLTEVQLVMQTSSIVWIAVEYRHDQKSSFTRGTWLRVNKDGVAFVRYTGIEFRLCIKALNYEDFKLDEVIVKWQASDKRYTRGPDANPINS